MSNMLFRLHRLMFIITVVATLIFQYTSLKEPVLAQSLDLIRSLAWSPNGTMLATVNDSGLITLWDSQAHKMRQWQSQQTNMRGIVWSPNNNYLLTSDSDNIRLWTVQGTLVLIFHGCDMRTGLQWSPDGDLLALSPKDMPLQIWETDSDSKTGTEGRLITSLGIDVNGADQDMRLAWSPDGKKLAAGHPYINKVYLWNFDNTSYTGIALHGAATTGLLHILQLAQSDDDRYVEQLQWSSDSSILAVGYHGWSLQLWSKQGQLLKTVSDYPDHIPGDFDLFPLGWSPDGNFLAASDGQKEQVNIWSKRGQLIDSIPKPDDAMTGLAWSKQGILAIGYIAVPTVYLWQQGQPIQRLAPPFKEQNWVIPAWSADGSFVAGYSEDVATGITALQVWTAAGAAVASLEIQGKDDFGWSPSGHLLAIAVQDQVCVTDVSVSAGLTLGCNHL